MKSVRLDDKDRAQWIDNYEPLYVWWKRSRTSKAKFIVQHRDEITSVIKRQLSIPEPDPTQAEWEAEMRRINHPWVQDWK